MDVFISYSSKDSVLAQRFCDQLRNHDISYWIAMENHDFGDRYADTIVTQIEESKVFLLLVTESSNVSKHVINEVNTALNRNKIILPVLIGDFAMSRSMEYYLSSCHYLYYSENEFFWNNLIERIANILKKPTNSAPVSNTTQKKPPHYAPNNPYQYQSPSQQPVSPVNQPKKKKGKGCLISIIITTLICAILLFVLFAIIIFGIGENSDNKPETFSTAVVETLPPIEEPQAREINPEYTEIFANADLTEQDFVFEEGLENYVLATDDSHGSGIITKLEYGVKDDIVYECIETSCFPADKYSEEKLQKTYEPFMDLKSCDINIYSITDYIIVEVREYNLDNPEYLQELIDIGFIVMDDPSRKISMTSSKEAYLQNGYVMKYVDQM